MKLPYKWIKEYVNIDESPKAFAHKMTMTGSKVEGYESLGKEITGVVMGRVEKIDQHPNAERLVICQINIGKEENIQICTAATNLKVGDYIPVATHGSHLVGGINIKKTKMRGEESNGMLCSIAELGLTLNDYPNAIEDGILVFDEPTNLGEDARIYTGLNETIFDFEITPNRPDCLSAIGLAKEAAASYGLEFKGHTRLYHGKNRRSRSVPPLYRRSHQRCKDRALSHVAQTETERLRRETDKQHRRHNQLCHAGVRSADARL